MSMLERLSDARGTIEGKVVAMALALLLVMPVVSVTAFAEPEDHHGLQDPVKVEEYTPGEDPVPIEKTVEPSGQAEEPQEPAEEPVDATEAKNVRYNDANGSSYVVRQIQFDAKGGNQWFPIHDDVLADDPSSLGYGSGFRFAGWTDDKATAYAGERNEGGTVKFTDSFMIPGGYYERQDANKGSDAFELYPVYSKVEPLEVEAADYEGEYDGKYHGITVTVKERSDGMTPEVYYRLEGSDSDWDKEAPQFKDVTTDGSIRVDYLVKCGSESVRDSRTVTIDPAPVTITVNNASKKFGDKDPDFKGTVKGLFGSDELGDIAYSRTNSDEEVDTYEDVLTATVTNLNPNYQEPKVVLGTFTINAADAADISATPVTKTFNGQSASIEVSIEASAEDDWTLQYSTDDGDDKTWSTENPSFVGAGTYKVYVKATCPGHADAGWVSATVTITPAPVTITVNDASKTVGAADPEITGTIEGEVAGFPLTGVAYQRRTNAQAVGTYVDDLTVVFDVDPNYDVTVIDGDFTINPLAAPGTVPGDGGPVDAIVSFLATPIIGGTPAVDGPMASIADDGTPMASIDDEDTPLGAFDHPLCWIHYYILLGIIITAIYGGGVIARRLNHSRKVKSYEDDARGASRSKDRAASPAAAKAQPVMAERADA